LVKRYIKGQALIIVLIIILVVLVLGNVLATLAVHEKKLSYRQADWEVLLWAATAGIEDAIYRITYGVDGLNLINGVVTLPTQQLYPADESTPIAAYRVTVDGTGNASRYIKVFTITSEATLQSDPSAKRTVVAVIKQENFGKYLYFTNSETSSVASGQRIWWTYWDKADGPVHSNDTFNIFWKVNNPPNPIFLGQVTSAASSINYDRYGSGPDAPQNENEYKQIFKDGSAGLKLGVERIELPQNVYIQKSVAWGATTGFPTQSGVYLPNDGYNAIGGIYIVGDCSINMSVSGNTQVFTITQGSQTTTVSLDLSAGQTKIQPPTGSAQIYSGLINGVIYCDGNITSLQGKVKGGYNIVADLQKGYNITITNNITYSDDPRTNPNSQDRLGLMARNIIISTSAPNDLEIDALILAGCKDYSDGSFYYAGWQSYLKGTLTVYGGIIQNKRGPVGTFSSSTGQKITGYSKNYHYDSRLLDNPPPYFATTGKYYIAAWRDLGRR
jgi:hypothetical protein